ncbi:response regulator [Sinorhizobium medicae]|uniref:Two component transcriptional regulator, winged helix family n=1 Tax=Sinorhizobium medicae TaxID=110321 RepID=A0A508WZ62_9HYPH|nr:response regulator transcription factor [Sinorhizobium medicae]MBO1941018.1 response regulator transcription factor [Sinorhizobium medicae]MDX0426151.1 response regulator [Sinorhizobium medicae]MDX0430659.1 response regulator [Sinorhizobium medicae]MDX0443034.1 response regulator [Sinorhizobium medicae]MDX0460553.1 response regulator [Sinorhizobium medicae]
MPSAEVTRPVIVIVDDDPNLRGSLATLLEANGFSSLTAQGSVEFFTLAEKHPIDLALVDLRLNGESGLALSIRIREHHRIPIVMLTGQGDETDRIIGLESSADDFIMKPFNPRELLARLRAILRRSGHPALATPDRSARQSKHFGRFKLNLNRRELIGPDGTEISLTNAEYRLLEYFLHHPDRVIPRAELMAELGNDLSLYMDRTIDVLILRLRRKIEQVPSKPVHLQTRRGQGYIFVETS